MIHEDDDKPKLTAFTLKLSDDDRKAMKVLCAIDRAFKFQYQMLDAAVTWANQNKDDLVAIANPKDGENKSYYVSDSVDFIESLESAWNCNTTRALFTALVSYLRHREKDLLGPDQIVISQ